MGLVMLIYLWYTLNIEWSVCMKDSTMEIYADNIFLFPYNYFEFLGENEWHSFSDYCIYFITQRDKLKIEDFKFRNGLFSIKYLNCNINKIFEIKNIKLFEFNIPDEFVEIRTLYSGSCLEIWINEKGRNFLTENNFNSSNCFYLNNTYKVTIYQFLSMLENQEKKQEDLELLYIGQSIQPRKRLSNHKTLQKITRDKELNSPGKEIMLLLFHPATKYYNYFENNSLQLKVVLGNSSWMDTEKEHINIGCKELLDVSEAILIQKFCPPYNVIYKDTIPNNKQKTFLKLEKDKINDIKIFLRLSLENEVIMNISTNEFTTNSRKGLMLSCTIEKLTEKKRVNIQVEEINRKLFDI